MSWAAGGAKRSAGADLLSFLPLADRAGEMVDEESADLRTMLEALISFVILWYVAGVESKRTLARATAREPGAQAYRPRRPST